jgi:hypothetical protein
VLNAAPLPHPAFAFFASLPLRSLRFPLALPLLSPCAENFPTIGKKFSNHWKLFFQSLENPAEFSNHWKNFFQSLEKTRKFFPIVGKRAKNFSNRWKTRRRGFRLHGPRPLP